MTRVLSLHQSTLTVGIIPSLLHPIVLHGLATTGYEKSHTLGMVEVSLDPTALIRDTVSMISVAPSILSTTPQYASLGTEGDHWLLPDTYHTPLSTTPEQYPSHVYGTLRCIPDRTSG